MAEACTAKENELQLTLKGKARDCILTSRQRCAWRKSLTHLIEGDGLCLVAS
jgi:hypothetical protein